ncbi:PREDICTED: uncharacterized protein C5orf34 homolog [Elephantulus edwardii]|uniref:uncharacterized protein C5orf34 homolog n=1 Tax=Elephantulus edwardii TaxID=28737 RepID=UPI0003F0D63D|nr:PREDICTED: uncharacterized protein C5orf34 homolog [Elephantulus edwardii]
MAAEVRMVLHEDDSVQVQYADGSRLQLSPCGSEFLFEKAPPVSAHPLEQPERIRQRTQFVISTYREQLQRALDFRNSSATYPFLPEALIPSERKKHILIDVSEVTWPNIDVDGAVMCVDTGSVKITSLEGHAYLCLPRAQHEFTVHFLCKVSQKPSSTVVLSENHNQARNGKLIENADKNCTFGSLSGEKLKNKEKKLYSHFLKPREHLEKRSCVDGAEGMEKLHPRGTEHTCVYAWVRQLWPVASCPEEWKYPLSLALNFLNKMSETSITGTDITRKRLLSPDVSEKRKKEVSVLPRALPLSCPAPHMHRWNFCDSWSHRQFNEDFSYPELVKVVWSSGITYRLSHKNMNSIEIYPGDGSIFKSEGVYFGNYFTYCPVQEGSEEREEKTYSVNNLPPDRPGRPFSVCSLLQQAMGILQHCAKMQLSLSHNYRICCWKMASVVNNHGPLPLLLRESFMPSVGRFLAYSDNKVHAVFLDGVTLTLNWDFSFCTEKRQVNQSCNLGWCKLTFPDGQDKLIKIEHPGPHERYVTTVISWCRKLTQAGLSEMSTQPSSSVLEESWSVASELEKIQKFNLLLESSGILGRIPDKENQLSPDPCKPASSETWLEVHEKSVSVALKKTSEILQDIDSLLSKTKK